MLNSRDAERFQSGFEQAMNKAWKHYEDLNEVMEDRQAAIDHKFGTIQDQPVPGRCNIVLSTGKEIEHVLNQNGTVQVRPVGGGVFTEQEFREYLLRVDETHS